MRIGFDVSQTADQMAGCGVVADQWLRHLVTASSSDVFIPYPIFGNYRSPNFVQATRPLASNVEADLFRLTMAEHQAAWDTPGANLQAFLGRPDVVHANNFFCPVGLPVPVVYTLYDLSKLDCPQFHTERNRQGCFNGIFDASLYANHIVAISDYSRRRFLTWFPFVARDRVSLIYPAARPSIVARAADDVTAGVLRKLGIEPDGFWLAVGTIEPRKNYPLLLEVYARLRDELGPRTLPLCIAGQAGWLESIEPQIRQLGLEAHVQWLGFVSDADLAILYRSCFALVYPSAYEGFGLPVVEAMANGAAVVASRSTSLPEVVGSAGLLADPESPAEYLSAMKRLVLEPSLREELRGAALRQAGAFSWERGASDLSELYHAVVNSTMRSGVA